MEIVNQALLAYRKHRRKVKLENEAKRKIKMHGEWSDLNYEEFECIDKKYSHSYMMYKNTYGSFSKYFVPDSEYQAILLPTLNSINYSGSGTMLAKRIFMDKNYFELMMPDISFPKTIFRRINNVYMTPDYKCIEVDGALKLLEKHEKAVFKLSMDSGHGKGVSLISSMNYCKSLLESFGSDYIVQEVIVQHEFLSNFNDSSVNAVRITTVNLKGKCFSIGAILRVGAPGSFCDHLGSAGINPRIAAIDNYGELYGCALDTENFSKHEDIWGTKIQGHIPKFDQMLTQALDNHSKFPSYGILGWDFTVDNNDTVICLEYNARIPGIVQSQALLGPVFQKMGGYRHTA